MGIVDIKCFDSCIFLEKTYNGLQGQIGYEHVLLQVDVL
jgi:hypothetical protein